MLTLNELTTEQIRQAELAALRKAAETIKRIPLRLSEKLRAIETLIQARLRLEIMEPAQGDIETSALIVNFKKEKYTEIEAVLRDNPPLLMLGTFGTVPSILVLAVFKGAGTSCPVELQSFHMAYQQELKNLSSRSNVIAPVPTPKPA